MSEKDYKRGYNAAVRAIKGNGKNKPQNTMYGLTRGNISVMKMWYWRFDTPIHNIAKHFGVTSQQARNAISREDIKPYDGVDYTKEVKND